MKPPYPSPPPISNPETRPESRLYLNGGSLCPCPLEPGSLAAGPQEQDFPSPRLPPLSPSSAETGQ